MSNKTPKATVKKTKWARNVVLTALGFALVLSFLAAFSFEEKKAPSGNNAPQSSNSNSCDGLRVQEVCYPLERADTNEKRIKGLSAHPELKPQTGMLFIFDNPERQCIWMKDMNFNIDIIWLDTTKKITKIEQNVSPATYPNSFCADNTKYVIELNSGDAAKLQLGIGQQLTF